MLRRSRVHAAAKAQTPSRDDRKREAALAEGSATRRQRCAILGAPVEDGVSQPGCAMGPAGLRTAGLLNALRALGIDLTDHGDAACGPDWPDAHANPALKRLGRVAAWTAALQSAVARLAADDAFPIVLGGDHSVAMGVLSALSPPTLRDGRPLFLLWLDAHPDIHTLESSGSGHLHGVPIAYLIGEPGFTPFLPPNRAPLCPSRICMMGVRSVDPPERALLTERAIAVHDMRAIDEFGVAPLLRPFLRRVAAENGRLHVTLDADFLDPNIAPGVSTTAPGGASFREARLIMELLHDSGLVTSLDVVELNPFLDERGRTALLLVDLVASLMGRRVLDRPTPSFG